MDKRIKFLRIGVTAFTLFFCFSLLFSQEKIGKEFTTSFDFSKQSKLNIKNKYGNIDVRNWDKETIEVTVQIKLIKLDNKKAEEVLNMIKIKNLSSGGEIIFETEFDDDFSKNISKYNKNDSKFEVNYIVHMPHSVPVFLSNKYGSIFVDKLSSSSQIEIKYGSLKANKINVSSKEKMTELIVGYSDVNIEECSWLKVNMKYSNLKIEESKALMVISKYSKLFVDRGSSLVCKSKYDKYQIGVLANFVSEAGYSNFNFKSIGKKLHCETSYTEVKVGFVPASFEEININTRYGTYKIGIEDGASYSLQGIAKYGNIEYPEDSKINRFQENTELKVSGKVGKNNSSKAKVIVESKYGSIKL